MTSQRVLDNDDNDQSTTHGAADQGSHHDDMLGHILEDTSLDEWDVIPEASDVASSNVASDVQDAALAATSEPKIENAPSLFSFSLMQKFGGDSNPLLEPPSVGKEEVTTDPLVPITEDSALLNPAIPILLSDQPVFNQVPSIDVPSSPVAVGP